MAAVSMICGDARSIPLSDDSVHCVVTSPPYWGLRDYGIPGQLGLEKTPEEYIRIMVDVFREVNRVLRGDGTLWLNMGDCYATGAGSVGEHPGGGERGARWKGEITRYRDEKRRSQGQPSCNGRGEHHAGNSGKAAYRLAKVGPMTQPNRMPIEGLKPKDLVGMPWRLAFALQSDGWYLRSDIIWSKPNPMPESVTDRPTKAHEYIFLLSRRERYYYNQDAVKERAIYFEEQRYKTPDGWDTSIGIGGHGSFHSNGREKGEKQDKQRGHGRRHNGFNDRWDLMTVKEQCSGMRNKRDVWEVSTQPFPEAHFATFPEELIKPCILAGCPVGGIVFDPFAGSGTTLLVARALQCRGIGIELNPAYIEIAKRRLRQQVLAFDVDGEYSREV